MADNDKHALQCLKARLRKVRYRLQYLTNPPISTERGGYIIKELLASNKPFMLCRIGAEESRTVYKYLKHQKYEERNTHNIMYNAGVFPNDIQTINAFCEAYADSLHFADGVFTWGCVGEGYLVRHCAPKETLILRNATNNILFLEKPWTTALEGKKVLVVHPFVDTIAQQYEKREKLFDHLTLPTFASITYVKAVQTNAGEHANSNFDSWFDALAYMKQEIDKQDFEVALIAAGAYGLPLAAYVKQMGKQAIHMASNMQILFGIRGKRWDGWSEWVPYFNEYWAYPSVEETPQNKQAVEGGSYWR